MNGHQGDGSVGLGDPTCNNQKPKSEFTLDKGENPHHAFNTTPTCLDGVPEFKYLSYQAKT